MPCGVGVGEMWGHVRLRGLFILIRFLVGQLALLLGFDSVRECVCGARICVRQVACGVCD